MIVISTNVQVQLPAVLPSIPGEGDERKTTKVKGSPC